MHAPGHTRELFPFSLRGADFDNDSLFMNDLVFGWCRVEGLEVTRSGAYRKNDQILGRRRARCFADGSP